MTATKLLKRNTSLYIQINVICDLYGDKRMRDAKARLGSDVDWLGFMAAFNRGYTSTRRPPPAMENSHFR